MSLLSALLLRSGLVPRWLAGLGLVGYALHMAGAGGELFGAPISLVLLVPGGIFEVTLAIWLLVEGFTPAAYDGAGSWSDAHGRGPHDLHPQGR